MEDNIFTMACNQKECLHNEIDQNFFINFCSCKPDNITPNSIGCSKLIKSKMEEAWRLLES